MESLWILDAQGSFFFFDSLRVVNALTPTNDRPWKIVNIIQKVRKLFKHFDTVDVHTLEQLGLRSSSQEQCVLEEYVSTPFC